MASSRFSVRYFREGFPFQRRRSYRNQRKPKNITGKTTIFPFQRKFFWPMEEASLLPFPSPYSNRRRVHKKENLLTHGKTRRGHGTALEKSHATVVLHRIYLQLRRPVPNPPNRPCQENKKSGKSAAPIKNPKPDHGGKIKKKIFSKPKQNYLNSRQNTPKNRPRNLRFSSETPPPPSKLVKN